ncbi:type IV pilus modification PilV family protein [Ralstonia soli]|uniref:Prepilin-type N-terminal cleavage/methylation domain-containing protein n=1 Tax=Ralstonia soli TaxID=2953896 RepID=A0ABT1AP24_9RALS|nr:prepilin-type N-terminal cleavage/methylation domain-containing protein [Ralstonia soli]MCO5400039.1 prepilin-type N-terminal cleavage/methylation domain-containing protein [Ralstonia soli]
MFRHDGTPVARLGRTARSVRNRGFTLLEAMVAMLIVGFGMVALVRVQSTLTQNADMARQRSEATRLAEEKIEQLRAYNSVISGVGVSWADVTNGTDTPSSASNTSYSRSWTLGGAVTDSMRPIQVTVSWQDRTAAQSSVTTRSYIARFDPALAGALSFPLPGNGNIKLPKNRNLNIPIKATDLGGGQSAYQLTNNFAVVFSNVTGYVVMRCSGTITSSSQLSSQCTSYNAYILAGYVSLGGKKAPSSMPATGLNLSQVTPYISHGSTDCVFNPAVDQNTGSTISGYYYYLCVMAVNSSGGGWSGTVNLTGMSSGSPAYLVCRYQYPATGNGNSNERNVQPYSNVTESLDQQNYAITLDNSCSNISGSVLHQSCTSSGACPANPD